MLLYGLIVSATITSISAQFYQHGTGRDKSCYMQKGIALKWVSPFEIRGEVIGFVEGVNNSQDYYPVALHPYCLYAHIAVTGTHVQLILEQWNHFDSILLLATHISEVDFTVELTAGDVRLYGCTATYRVILQVHPKISCGNKTVMVLISYRRPRTKEIDPF
uniref:Uncharacterized protein n=1 Tax=Anopheles farauti TaxID=69004 RepID=A0A182QMQ5_9DIPT